jgi:nitrite reductase (NO-forming)
MKKWLFLTFFALPGVYLASAPRNTGPYQEGTAESIARGKDVYTTNCLGCHQIQGEGLTGVYPPLAKSDHLTKDMTASITILLKGQKEEITVNGTKYSLPMAPTNHLSDQQIADVLNYIGNSWGNQFNTVTPDQVKSKRE